MDSKEYITSGKIEEYILGLLSPKDEKELLEFAEKHPEIKQEIEANQAALNQYANAFSQIPPADLEESIIAELDALAEEEANAPQKRTLTSSVNQEKLAQNTQIKTISKFRIPLIAASVALLLSLVGNVLLYQNWQNTQRKLHTALLDNTQFAQKLQVNQTENQLLAQKLDLLKNPANQYVELKGSDAFPESKVLIYWDDNAETVFLQIENLPEPPEGKQYQLWAIYQDKAIDAGVFETGDKAKQLQKMKAIAGADMFVVTLEKKGGVPQPEGQAYVIGKVS